MRKRNAGQKRASGKDIFPIIFFCILLVFALLLFAGLFSHFYVFFTRGDFEYVFLDELFSSLKSGVMVGFFLGISIWLISYFGSDKAD